MPNDISLTVRLPHDLNMQLATISKRIGLTKTNFIRSAIHDFLTSDEAILDFSSNQTNQRDRLVLNINQITYNLLENACQKYKQSMNSIIIAVSILALERSARWLQSVTK